MYFRMKFALFFRFFDSWYIIKYLFTEISGKQYVLWTRDCRCFPRAQSISVKYCLQSVEFLSWAFILDKVFILDNPHYRLNFHVWEKSKICPYSKKKHPNISQTAKFGCGML